MTGNWRGALISKLSPCGPIPHNMAQTFDGPPTLERSGSEHRRAVTSSRSWGKRGLVRMVEPSLMVKKDGMILEILIFKNKR